MSKLFTLLVFFFVMVIDRQASGQSSNYSLKDFNTWDCGASLGYTLPRTDITGKGGFGFSLDASKFFSNRFALQFRFMHASLNGQDMNRPEYKYESTVNYDITLNAVLQSNQLINMPGNKLALYASAGAGIINYTPDIWLDGGGFKLHGIYSQYSQEYDTFDFSNSTDFILPVAVGAKFRISEKLSVNAEYSYRITNTDKLDGFFKLLSSNDNFSYISAGIVFHLGGKSKTIEWVDPDLSRNKEIDALRKKLHMSTKDTDEDGVPDMHDNEPETPKGTPVYGDGRSVDADADGVPDRLDDEPFSSKNAKVDAKGVEIKKVVIPPPVVEQKPVVAEKKMELPVIYFLYDIAEVQEIYLESLRQFGQTMRMNTSQYIITLFCDNPTPYNIRLNNRRAENVKNHLVTNYNINPSRLTTEIKIVSYDPLMQEKNRRAEIRER